MRMCHRSGAEAEMEAAGLLERSVVRLLSLSHLLPPQDRPEMNDKPTPTQRFVWSGTTVTSREL